MSRPLEISLNTWMKRTGFHKINWTKRILAKSQYLNGALISFEKYGQGKTKDSEEKKLHHYKIFVNVKTHLPIVNFTTCKCTTISRKHDVLSPNQ